MDDATIIKALRVCAADDDGSCSGCPFEWLPGDEPGKCADGMRAAADRLEALVAEVAECHKAVAGAKLIADQASGYAGDVVRLGLDVSRLTAERDAARADYWAADANIKAAWAKVDEVATECAERRKRARAAEAHSKTVSSLPNCNDCADSKLCAYRAPWGQLVRFNCPLWRGSAKNTHQSPPAPEIGG